MNKKLAMGLIVVCGWFESSRLTAQTPTDDELRALERQIEQQEIGQAEAKRKAEQEASRKAKEVKQRAAEESKRQAEEAERKQEEEAAQRDAEQAQVEAAARLQAEQQRQEQERLQRAQFDALLASADAAVKSREYAQAEQLYAQALAIFPEDAAALAGQAQAREFQKICSSLVGEWDYILGSVHVVNADGTLELRALFPNTGTWECTDPARRKFTLRWVVGGIVDDLTLSVDGNSTDVMSGIGIRFHGQRKGTREEVPPPKNPLYGR